MNNKFIGLQKELDELKNLSSSKGSEVERLIKRIEEREKELAESRNENESKGRTIEGLQVHNSIIWRTKVVIREK